MSLFPPKSSGGLAGAADRFCLSYCRQPDDTCPFGWTRDRCPLWQFVEANLPTRMAPAPPPKGQACGYHDNARSLAEADAAVERIAETDFDPNEGYEWPD